MKRVVFTFSAAVVLVTCGLAFAQEAAEERNEKYEKLKVLEPLVGSYSGQSTNDETGMQTESLMIISWSDSKKMLTGEIQVRSAEKGADLKAVEWSSTTIPHHYVWNEGTGKIEYIHVAPWRGVVGISEVTVKAKGVYSYSRVRTTASPAGQSDMTVKVTDAEMTINFTNRKNAEGESLEDTEYVMKRVNGAE